MIQELLGSSGAGLIGGERRIPIDGNILETTPSFSSPSSFSSSIPTFATSTTTKSTKRTSTTSENLKCPRCDSSNTKFCYYNNYNLTQPRHFCKTCRRYWTKGGALRNVPIGGGCRKNRTTSHVSTSTSAGKSLTTSNTKMKSMAYEIGRSSGLGLNGFDYIYELPSSPIMWPLPQNNSHIFSLLRADATQNHNPNPIAISNSIKEGGAMIGNHIATEPTFPLGGLVSGRALGLDPLSQASSQGLCNPLWRNGQVHNEGLIVDDQVHDSGLQQLYQRLRSSANYCSENSSAILVSGIDVISSSSSSSNIVLESAPAVGGGELGFWSPVFSTGSDLPTTTNYAYRSTS